MLSFSLGNNLVVNTRQLSDRLSENIREPKVPWTDGSVKGHARNRIVGLRSRTDRPEILIILRSGKMRSSSM